MKDRFFLHENPFLKILIPFFCGLILGVTVSINFPVIALQMFLAVLFASILLINIFYKRLQFYRKPWSSGLLIAIFLFVFAFVYAENFKETTQKHYFAGLPAQTLMVKIIQEPKISGGLVRFKSTVDNAVFNGKISACTGSLMITIKLLPDQTNTLKYGDELLIKSNYTDISGPANPAEFNYKGYLAGQNIYKQAFLNPPQYFLISKNNGSPGIAYALQIREHLVQKLKRYLSDPAAISVASTLILGYRAELGDDVRAAYAKTGTMHVLSVSGMHVALVYLVIGFLLQFLNRSRKTLLLKSLISITLIWLYAMITGFSPSVCRAALMITFIVCGKSYNRHISSFNILLVSAFILLIYNPLYILDIGFQLSYLAVGGLIILQPIIQNCIEPKNAVLRRLWSLLSVSLAAQAITFPISIYYFHQFPVYFLLSNLFIVLPAMLTMYIGLAFLIIPEVNLITRTLANLLQGVIQLMNNGLVLIEKLRFGTLDKLWISAFEVLLIYTILVFFFRWMARRSFVFLQMSAVFIVILFAGSGYKNYQINNQQKTTFLSIPNHTAIVFNLARSAFIVTDISLADKSYRYTIQPFMDSCKIQNVKLIGLDENFSAPQFQKQKQMIEFNGQLIFMADTGFNGRHYPVKIKTDAVSITQNPSISMEQITSNFIFETLIIDSKNSNYHIKKFLEEAENDGRKIFILKRNKSLQMHSN